MRMNRRNVLVGLGTIVAGGGAALGTGAFSSVEATRSVTIGTAGDTEALLTLEIRSDTLGGEDDDGQMYIDVENLNENAETRFDEALFIENNVEDVVSIEVLGDGLPGWMILQEDGSDVELPLTLGAGENKLLDVVFDIPAGGIGEGIDDDITIRAAAQEDN